MARFKLSRRSLSRLVRVHGDLVKVVHRAIEITECDFGVTQGMRTKEQQKELVACGASRTMNSRHLTGHAVDVVAWKGGKISWSWPLYHQIATAMKQAALELQVDIQWGGDWVSFKDGPHFQLTHESYPDDCG